MCPELLAQQELLEVPPVRRLIVPHGHTSWWGADLGTTRLALAYVAPDGSRGARTVPFPTLKGSERLSAIYELTRAGMAEALAAGWPRPGVVMTEQPSGSKQSVNLPFIMAAGVIHAGMWDGLRQACGRPVVIEECVSGHWKLVACGQGNLYKPGRVKGQPAPPQSAYAVFRWAEMNGWRPLDWNEADAAGMAEAARREVALEQR
jgi:hypothetical protein